MPSGKIGVFDRANTGLEGWPGLGWALFLIPIPVAQISISATHLEVEVLPGILSSSIILGNPLIMCSLGDSRSSRQNKISRVVFGLTPALNCRENSADLVIDSRNASVRGIFLVDVLSPGIRIIKYGVCVWVENRDSQ